MLIKLELFCYFGAGVHFKLVGNILFGILNHVKKSFIKGVTMEHIFFKCKESCWLKVYRFIWMIENKILKTFFSTPKLLRGKHFSAFRKSQKSTSKFVKAPESKKMRN